MLNPTRLEHLSNLRLAKRKRSTLKLFWCTAITLTALQYSTHLTAAPLMLEQAAKIANPDPAYYFGSRVAIDGDDLIATGTRVIYGPVEEVEDDDILETAVYLFHRSSDGVWRFVTKLLTDQSSLFDPSDVSLAMHNGVAAMTNDNGLVVFERTAAGWVRAVTTTSRLPGNTDVEVDSGTILASYGRGDYSALAVRKNATGQWSGAGTVNGPTRTPDSEQSAGDVDVSGNTLIVGGYDEDNVRGEAHIFSGAPGAYAKTAILTNTSGDDSFFGEHVALDHNFALVSRLNYSASAVDVFHYQAGTWQLETPLRPVDAFRRGGLYGVDLEDGNAIVGYPWDDPRRGSVCVFRRNASGVFSQVATLLMTDQPDGYGHAFHAKVSGRTVAVDGANAVYVFELPNDLTPPAATQYDFEGTNAADWTAIPNSSFSVVASGATHVYRQTSLVGDAGALLATDMKGQAIQADVNARAFAGGGGEKWFGLVVRYTDPNNFYYLTVRNTNLVQIRKVVNGTITVLASADMPLTLNRDYRLRLEAIGTRVRAYVDNNIVLEATGTTHTHGRAGIFMYKASTDYDNVVVTGNPRTLLYSDDFDNFRPINWQLTGVGNWTTVSDSGSNVYAQTTVSGDARAITGVSTDDQIVQTRVKPTAFASGGEQWFGLAARYQDNRNYYYVTLRNNNTVSLRKVVDGAITVLDSAPLAVTLNTWYRLKWDAVGSRLRVYVNDTLLLETSDSTFANGQYGALMYRAAARYDNFSAYQP